MKKHKPSKRLSLDKTTIRALQARDLRAAAGGCSMGIRYTNAGKEGCSGSCTSECSFEPTYGYCESAHACN